MSEDRSSKQDSTGLIRRMFRRTSNPKSVEAASGSDNLSSEKKSQMLIHKQRNDLERQKEFAELRDLHTERLLKETGTDSQLSASEMSKANTRQKETLNKINQLESQMASRWSRHQDSHAQTTLAADPTTAKSASGQSLLRPPVDLSIASSGGADSEQFDLGALTDPALEEVGVLFASNEDEQVEQNLKNMLEVGSGKRSERMTWLTLLDFYRATGRQASFEKVAMDYMSVFSESAPQWLVFDPALLRRQKADQASAIGAAAYWRSPEVQDEEAAKAMEVKLVNEGAKKARIMDWSALQEVTPEGAEATLAVLEKLDKKGVSLQVASLATIMDILSAETRGANPDANKWIWMLRLELLRLFDTDETFEMEAMEYCLAHEVSPPAWAAPNSTTEDLDAVDDLAEDEAHSTSMGGLSTMIGDFSTEFYGQNVKAPLRLRGAYKSSMAKELKELDSKIFEDGGFLSIDCEKLVRLDFSAAGDLLNWIAEKSAKGYSVQFVRVHRLVALFFIVMGIATSSRVSLRKD